MGFHQGIQFVVKSCIKCHALFAITATAAKRLYKSKEPFYCPYCRCSMEYLGETDADKLKKAERALLAVSEDRERCLVQIEEQGKKMARMKGGYRAQLKRAKET